MLVVGAVGRCDAKVKTIEGLLRAAELGEGLGGHLVGGNVVGVVLDERGEFCEGGVGLALADVLHGKPVAGEGVGGVELEDFGECGDLVHALMVRCGIWGWQVSGWDIDLEVSATRVWNPALERRGRRSCCSLPHRPLWRLDLEE